MNVPIELDKPRTLRFDIAAIEDLEQQLGGKPLGQIVNDLAQMGIRTLNLCLLHGLKHEDPTLNPNLVRRMVQTAILEERYTVDVLLHKVKLALDESGLFKTAEETTVGNAGAEPVH